MRQSTARHIETKPTDLDCESAGKLTQSTSAIAIYYYYTSRKLILILLSQDVVCIRIVCLSYFFRYLRIQV